MLIRAIGLGHSFPGVGELFQGLDFSLSGGDLVAVVGPSGSGKSTLLSLLAGWETPTRGHITQEGINSVGWVFQNPHGTAGRTALDHVALAFLAQGQPRRDAETYGLKILDLFGLVPLARRKFKTLSGGEGQRLMLAMAVAKRPDLLLVDEPTAQLDPTSAATVNSVLSNLATLDTIVVVATHDPDTRDACPTRLDLRNHVSLN